MPVLASYCLVFAIMASAGRRQHVQELRRLAKEYDVERVAGNANKEKVAQASETKPMLKL